MNHRVPRRTLAAAIVAVGMAMVTACGPTASGAPTTSTNPGTTSPMPSATVATPSATPAGSEAAIAEPIPEGDYTTGPITAEMMVAAVEAHGLDAADARSFAEGEGFDVHEVVTMRLRDGTLTLLQSLDGGPATVGWEGGYAFADSQTMVASDGYPIKYGIEWDGDKLLISVVEDRHPDPFDLVAQVALYESSPLTRAP
jgi:hypothetical protein